jgi:two-component system, LytTR family, response regulator
MTRTIRVLIVDDEPLAREGIRIRLESAGGGFSVAGECASAPRALERIRQGGIDLVFLDIQMPGMDGFEMLAQVGEECFPEVIFVTAYDEHALRAFRVRALDYLLKPVDADCFSEALRRARDRIEVRDQKAAASAAIRNQSQVQLWKRLPLRSAALGTYFVETKDVMRIEAAGNYARLHTTDGRDHLLHATMNTLAVHLDPRMFLRVHRSRIVNLVHVVSIRSLHHGEYELTVRGGVRLVTGRRYRESVRNLLKNTSLVPPAS